MSCITASLTPVNCLMTATLEDAIESSMCCSMVQVGSIFALAAIQNIELEAQIIRVPSTLTVTLVKLGDEAIITSAEVCTPDIRIPYLEIEPTTIWVYPEDISNNDVLSNINWNIN